MRIRVSSRDNRLWVVATVARPASRRSTPIKFILDTGSTQTFLNQSSAYDLGLEGDLASLRRDSRDVFIGGGIHLARLLPDVLFLFEKEGGGVFSIQMPMVRVIEPRNQRTRQHGELPNILGYDVLTEGRLTTIIQPWREYFTITDEPVSLGDQELA